MNINDYIRDTDRISHAYIVTGGAAAALELARLIAQACVCPENSGPCGACLHCSKALRDIHPDIIHIRRAEDKREITVGQARAVRADAFVIPNEANKKVYIIHQADTMNAAAQNAMLKVLEEPPAHAVFLLLCENSDAFLPTVRSRCTLLRADDDDAAGPDDMSDLAEEFINACGSELSLARFTFSLDKLDRISFEAFLAGAEEKASELLASGSGDAAKALRCAHILRAIKRAREYSDANVSVGHTSGMLFAELTGRNEETN